MRTKHVFAVAWLAAAASGAAAQVPLTQPETNTAGYTITSQSGISEQQLARLAEKLATVDRIVAAVGQAIGGSTADQRRWLRERLYGMSLERVQALGTPASFAVATTAVTRTMSSAKELGDRQSDIVYRPIIPCRYIDTRNVGGPIAGSRGYDLFQDGSAYGGSVACDPKATAPSGDAKLIGAIAINVTIIGPATAPGFIGVRPTGSTNTTSLVNWYEGGPNVQAANEGVVLINEQSNPQIEFFGSPTNIVVDVDGIFTQPENRVPDVISQFSYTISPNFAGSAMPLPADRPVQILSTVVTPGVGGVSQATILQCCGTTPTFVRWVGLDSASSGAVRTGASATPGTEIVKLDSAGTIVLEVNDASSVRIHNKDTVSARTGHITVVAY